MKIGRSLLVLAAALAAVVQTAMPAFAVPVLVDRESHGNEAGGGTGTGYLFREGNTDTYYAAGRASTYAPHPELCAETWVDMKGSEHNTPYVFINCQVNAQGLRSPDNAFEVRYIGNNRLYRPTAMAVAVCLVNKAPQPPVRNRSNCYGDNQRGAGVDVSHYDGLTYDQLATLPDENDRPHLWFL